MPQQFPHLLRDVRSDQTERDRHHFGGFPDRRIGSLQPLAVAGGP